MSQLHISSVRTHTGTGTGTDTDTTIARHLSLCKIHCHGNAMDKNQQPVPHPHQDEHDRSETVGKRNMSIYLATRIQDPGCVSVCPNILQQPRLSLRPRLRLRFRFRLGVPGPGPLPVHESVAGTKSVSHSAWHADGSQGQTVSWQSAINTNSLTLNPVPLPRLLFPLPLPLPVNSPSGSWLNVFAHLPG